MITKVYFLSLYFCINTQFAKTCTYNNTQKYPKKTCIKMKVSSIWVYLVVPRVDFQVVVVFEFDTRDVLSCATLVVFQEEKTFLSFLYHFCVLSYQTTPRVFLLTTSFFFSFCQPSITKPKRSGHFIAPRNRAGRPL